MQTERCIAVLVMVLGAAIFLWRGTLAAMLPDTLWMRLTLSVGGTVALVVQIIRICRNRRKK